MPPRTVTRALECDAAPDSLFRCMADPTHIPAWAPDFADAVAREADGWRTVKDGKACALRVPADPRSRTVDYLRQIAPGVEGGAYLRAIPRLSGGAVLVMTVPLAPGADPEALGAVVEAELARLAELAFDPADAVRS